MKIPYILRVNMDKILYPLVEAVVCIDVLELICIRDYKNEFIGKLIVTSENISR